MRESQNQPDEVVVSTRWRGQCCHSTIQWISRQALAETLDTVLDMLGAPARWQQ